VSPKQVGRQILGRGAALGGLRGKSLGDVGGNRDA
jgi:hypothetical protein